MIFKRDGFKIYFIFMKNENRFYKTIFYILYLISRSSIYLSMLPFQLKEVDVQPSIECLTNKVIDNVIKTNNIDNKIIHIPSINLEKILAHDINIYDINKNKFELDEIKVLYNKKNISINELVDLRFRYSYINHLHIGYDNVIDDSEIIKNIKIINEQKDISKYFLENFEKNRSYYANKYLLNVNDEILKEILKERGMDIDFQRKKCISLYHQND